jgi:hypothetical protein
VEEGGVSSQHTRLIPFTEWYESRGIARSTAFKLLQITGITPAKQRSATSRTPINALNPDQLAQLSACADRLQDGETMAQLSASFGGRPRGHHGTSPPTLDLANASLPDAIASLVDAWLTAQDVEPAQQSQRREPRQYDPNEPQVRFTVDLPKSLHKRLKQAAINHERPMTDMARDALADWLDMSEAP